MFKWRDVPSNLICLVSIVFSVWAGIVAKELPGKLISFGVGAIFLSFLIVFYVWRYQFVSKVNYITIHGLHVMCGKRNSPVPHIVEKWTQELMQSICLRTSYRYESITRVVNGLYVRFSDDNEVTAYMMYQGSILKRIVRGYSKGNYIVVGSPKSGGNPNYVMKLFKHELSHPILGRIDNKYYDEKLSHGKMTEWL